jgi:hypothetical protein
MRGCNYVYWGESFSALRLLEFKRLIVWSAKRQLVSSYLRGRQRGDSPKNLHENH